MKIWGKNAFRRGRVSAKFLWNSSDATQLELGKQTGGKGKDLQSERLRRARYCRTSLAITKTHFLFLCEGKPLGASELCVTRSGFLS